MMTWHLDSDAITTKVEWSLGSLALLRYHTIIKTQEKRLENNSVNV